MEQLGNDFFKSKREERKERRWEYRQARANSFLIVIAGKDEVPFYFQAVAGRVKKEAGGHVDVVEIPLASEGRAGFTLKEVLAKTEEIVGKARILYQSVWIVFGRKDFASDNEFDRAVDEVRKKHYEVVWNNQPFEYWLYLHFDYSDAVLSQEDWTEKLKVIFRVRGLTGGDFRRDNPEIYIPLSERSCLEVACQNSARLREKYSPERLPSQKVPGVSFAELVGLLTSYMRDEIPAEDVVSEASISETSESETSVSEASATEEKQGALAEQSGSDERQEASGDAEKKDSSAEIKSDAEVSDDAGKKNSADQKNSTETSDDAAADSGSKK